MILQLVLIIKYNNPKAATVHFCWCRIFKLEIKVPIQTSYITRLVVPWRDKVPQIFNLIIFITKPRQVNMKSDIVASQVLFTRFRLLQASLRWKSGWFLLMNTSEAEDIAMFPLLFFIISVSEAHNIMLTPTLIWHQLAILHWQVIVRLSALTTEAEKQLC